MSLADLIAGKKTTTTARPATAISAIPARVATNQAKNRPTLAKIATIALATPSPTDDFWLPPCEPAPAGKRSPIATDTEHATFEQTGDPVSCRFWSQVCWEVGMYQEQCTRCTDCRIFKFLKINS